MRSAATRRRRNAVQQADRLTLLDRFLRHEVLSKVNVVGGYAQGEHGGSAESLGVIRRSVESIGDTVERVGALTGTGGPRPVDLAAQVEAAVSSARGNHPDAVVETGEVAEVLVLGSARIDVLFEHLIGSAVLRSGGDTPTVRVETTVTEREAVVRVVDDGPTLSAAERRLVHTQATPDRDDPRSGFSLSIARLLAEDVGGTLGVESPVAGGGAELIARLPRPAGSRGRSARPRRACAGTWSRRSSPGR